MDFPKRVMQDLVCEDLYTYYDEEGNETDRKLKIVLREHTGSRRWSQDYRIVFTDGERFYESHYSEGSTEQQDERPYEYDRDPILCREVVPVEKVVIDYVDREKHEKEQRIEESLDVLYPNRIMDTVQESAKDLHSIGIISDAELNAFKEYT